jgi:YidC/Oxa1 family membrane protein insertase
VNIFDLLIAQPIFNLLISIYSLIPGGDFGIALILFTILVRFALWPLVKKQLHQVKITRSIQPEILKIKKATKGNKQLESMQTLELYKKHGVNPFRSIGILLIQLPIFIAIFQVVRIFSDSRGEIARYTYDFLEGIGPIKALIENPDTFNQHLFGIFDLTQHAIMTDPWSINIFLIILSLAAAVTQYIMSKQTMPQQEAKKTFKQIMAEAAEGKQPDQSEMNTIVMGKMIKFLPIMMFFIMISLPGALALYYTTSNLVAVFQQHILLKKGEEDITEAVEDAKLPGKKATAKAREKQAKEASTVTRIVAKDDKPKSKKTKAKSNNRR